MTPDVVVDIGNSRMKWGRCADGKVAEMASLSLEEPAVWTIQAATWRLPSRWVLLVAVLSIVAAEVGGGAMARFRVELTRWARDGMLARPSVHGLVGVRDVDERILDEALVKFDAGLRQTSTLICREVSHLPSAIAAKRVTTMYQSISYLTAHLEARCGIGPWKDRKVELETEVEMMIDGFVGFMQARHTAVVPVSVTASREESEKELQTALL